MLYFRSRGLARSSIRKRKLRASIARSAQGSTPKFVCRYQQAHGQSCGPRRTRKTQFQVPPAQPRGRRFHMRDE